MPPSARPRRTPLRIAAALLAALFAAQAWAASLTLNFKDADIRALINTVSEITGMNFIVDPRVKGRVTIVSSGEMSEEEIYKVFLSVLRVHGFAAVPSGNVTKIVPDANAKQDAIGATGSERWQSGDELVTRVLTIEHVDANQLVPILRPLIPQQGHLAAYAEGNVLVVSDYAANVERLLTIIRRIDVAGDDEMEVLRLENAHAPELVRILTALTQRQGAEGGARATFVADERTNSILLGGPPAARLRLRTLISHLDTPLESSGNTQVIYLHYAQAADLAAVLTAVAEQDKQSGETVKIQADEQTNALVISAPPRVLRSLKSVISRLDIRRAQVLVEGVIAVISSNRAAELGIQWRSSLGAASGEGSLVGTNFPGTSSGSINSFPGDPVSFGTGMTLGLFRGGSVRALIRALASDGSTNILSTPSLVTLDNEEAEIHVGQNVPFVTGQYTNTSSTPDNPFQTIERKDVGILLKVKPQINEGDAVKLEINQEVSDVDRDTSGINLITNTRTIKTNVLVDDGQTIVLGGLIRDDLQETVQKVPALGDLPLLGGLFRNKQVNAVKTNLMVFLRPQILRDAALADRVSQGKYDYIRARQLETSRDGFGLLGGDPVPVLPPSSMGSETVRPLEPETVPVPLPEPEPEGPAQPAATPRPPQGILEELGLL